MANKTIISCGLLLVLIGVTSAQFFGGNRRYKLSKLVQPRMGDATLDCNTQDPSEPVTTPASTETTTGSGEDNSEQESWFNGNCVEARHKSWILSMYAKAITLPVCEDLVVPQSRMHRMSVYNRY